MKKILYLLLDHHLVKDKSEACQLTWLTEISPNSEVIFIGDSLMPDSVSGYEVYKPIKNEPIKSKDNITEKILLSFKYALSKEWDFLLRIDVDAYCNIKNLHSYIENLNTLDPLYTGQGIHFVTNKYPCYLSNVGDELPPKDYTYYYAQGGCYLLSRSALKSSINQMFYPAPIHPSYEDIMVGVAMEKSGIPLQDRPDLFNSGYKGRGWPKMGTRRNNIKEHIDMINSGYISTHTLNSKQIYRIHNSKH